MNNQSIENAPIMNQFNVLEGLVKKGLERDKEECAINDPNEVSSSDERTSEDFADMGLREKAEN